MDTKTKKSLRTIDLLYTAFFAVLMAVCSWISVPTVIPFTLQTFAVFAALCTLGGKRGTAAIFVYIALGAVGMPVFSNFSGGVGALLGTTGGYILGFLLTGIIYWIITGLLGKKLWVEFLAMTIGLAAVYAFGTAWYLVVYTSKSGPMGLGAALTACVVPFILPDICKMILAAALSSKMRRFLK